MLVSDGGDNCAPPAPCGVARALAKGGVALKIQAVGFQVASSARKQLQCIADAGGGRYVDADNAKQLGGQLRSLTARALRPYVTQGAALQGVPAPAEAKLYGPGQYTTTVSPTQPSWYSFRVGAGQTIAVSATLPNSDAGIPSVFKTELQDESLEFTDSDAATNSDDVLTAIVQAPVEENDLRDPPVGRFFYKLEVDPAPGQSGPFPVELFVRVTGKVIGAPGGLVGLHRGLGGGRHVAAAATTARATSCSSRARSAASSPGCWRAARWPGGGGGRHEGAARVLVLALALAAPASAQSPIAGAGSFNDAPVLAPGRYKDTLRGGEQLFYAVEPEARPAADGGPDRERPDRGQLLHEAQHLQPAAPEGRLQGLADRGLRRRRQERVAAGRGPARGERNAGGSSDSVFAEPGTYYVSVAADDFGRNLEADQFDTLLDLQVTGAVIPQATPTATAKPAATVQSGQTAGLGGGGGDGGSGELGITIVLGLALGGLVGFGVRRLRAPA